MKNKEELEPIDDPVSEPEDVSEAILQLRLMDAMAFSDALDDVSRHGE